MGYIKYRAERAAWSAGAFWLKAMLLASVLGVAGFWPLMVLHGPAGTVVEVLWLLVVVSAVVFGIRVWRAARLGRQR
jgi:hypothetical protein